MPACHSFPVVFDRGPTVRVEPHPSLASAAGAALLYLRRQGGHCFEERGWNAFYDERLATSASNARAFGLGDGESEVIHRLQLWSVGDGRGVIDLLAYAVNHGAQWRYVHVG